MDPTPELQSLRALRAQGRLIPFVGAGLSMRFALPSWNSLMRTLAGELEWDPDVFVASGNPMQLAQYYVSLHGIGKLRSLMDRAFNLRDDQVMGSRAHRALAHLGAPYIYTTNYDDAIERAFRLHGKPCSVISNIDDIVGADQSATGVVKFHGTFSDDQSLVLTESSYFDRMGFEGALDIKLRADLLGRSILFLGSSFNDINMRFLLYKLHKLRERARGELRTAFLVTFTANEVQRTILENWSIQTILLDPIDPARSLDEFLEAL